ncbi:MAG: deoxyribonuclease IV [Candidatus Adiutrix sp.]
MLNIGCHLSSSKGFLAMGQEALKIKANTFQFFTRNPRGSRAKEMNLEDAQNLVAFLKTHNFAPIMAHAPYTLNPAAKDPKVAAFALEVMSDDLKRLSHLPSAYYNLHPGSHVGQGLEAGLALIAQLLNKIISPSTPTTVLLETMAGKGTEVGGRFEELAAILKMAHNPQKLGVCLDTCHVHDSGYDIVNNLDDVLEEFDRIIGLKHLKAIHLNDSLNEKESKKDRHAKIGQGKIGLEPLLKVVNHPKLKNLPFYLETPNDLEGYETEIDLLRHNSA